MMKNSYDIDLKGRNYGDLLLETEYWTTFLAPNQSNIGTCVIALKRRCGTLKCLKDEEWLDFGRLVKILESSLEKAFRPVMFNWGALMNADYLVENPDPHVHWHFIPRYKEKIQFEGLTFEDKYFGSSTRTIKTREVPEDVRRKIIEKIRENIENI